MSTLIFLFFAAVVNELVLAAWTKAVADNKQGRAVGLTLLLEVVRLPTLILVMADVEPWTIEQYFRMGIAAVGYAVGTWLCIAIAKRRTK